MSYFLPKECPKCELLISPEKRPRAGDMSICPLCETVLVFTADLMVRLATASERMYAQVQSAKSAA